MTLRKRIIPCLDIDKGQTVKGVNFSNMEVLGSPLAFAAQYEADGADELVFLDISATKEKRKTLLPLVEDIAANLRIPFTVGGGINTLEDAALILKSGADKVALNSAAVQQPELIEQIASRFGSQCVVAAVDVMQSQGNWQVMIHAGKTPTSWGALAWCKRLEVLGAGEVLLTSMNHDGTKQGFAIDLLKAVDDCIRLPLIASGGAGNAAHFEALFTQTKVNAALAAGIFHRNQCPIPTLKKSLKEKGILVR